MARTPGYRQLVALLLSEGSSVSRSRRRFLRQGLGGAAVLAAGSTVGCASFDKWLIGNRDHLEDEVLILGGGLAGLTAAYQLKKSKVAYRVLEASSRLGGRVQTQHFFNSDNQFAELGAEYFDSNQKHIMALCKELNLPVQDVSYDGKKDRTAYWLDGKAVPEKEYRKRLRPFALRLAALRVQLFQSIPTELTIASLVAQPQMQGSDQSSLGDFLSTHKDVIDGSLRDTFENVCESEWGVPVTEINLLQFLARLDFEEKNSVSLGRSRLQRVEGGMSRIFEVLGQRVQGIVPGYSLRFQYQLISVRMKNGGYECTFKTAKGSETIWAKYVICTLPWSVLKDIDGIQGIDIGPLRKEQIRNARYATHAKVICSYKDPFWRKNTPGVPPQQGGFRGQLLGQVYWDSSRGQVGKKGILTSQRGGARGVNSGEAAPQDTLSDLQKFYRDSSDLKEENTQVANWNQRSFAKGSRLNILPGNYLKYLSSLEEPYEKSFFYFAGEHMSFRDPGTLNGAIETALAISETILRKVSV